MASKTRKKDSKAQAKAERAAERRRQQAIKDSSSDEDEDDADEETDDVEDEVEEDDDEEDEQPAKRSAATPKSKKKVTTATRDVVATRLGFYGLERKRPGDAFEMEIPIKNGKPVFPSWVVAAEDYEPEDEPKTKKRSNRSADVEV